ncbi:hypothetical protein G6F54_014370 [Rhizopus delemar]|nr:hypothetical protein G6F54_014370 [Rhizopus delemar]
MRSERGLYISVPPSNCSRATVRPPPCRSPRPSETARNAPAGRSSSSVSSARSLPLRAASSTPAAHCPSSMRASRGTSTG